MGTAVFGIEGPGRRGDGCVSLDLQVGQPMDTPMARRTLVVVDTTEIYVHWYPGRSKSDLARSLGVDRKTVRKYLAPAEASGLAPGGPPMSEADWGKLIKGWFPELADRRLRQLTWPEIDQHRDFIDALLGTVTVSTIHQRLRDEHKLEVSQSSLRRWIRDTLPDEAKKSQVTVLRDEVEPGSEAQIGKAALSFLELALKYIDVRWAEASARQRDSMTDSLATVVPALVKPVRGAAGAPLVPGAPGGVRHRRGWPVVLQRARQRRGRLVVLPRVQAGSGAGACP